MPNLPKNIISYTMKKMARPAIDMLSRITLDSEKSLFIALPIPLLPMPHRKGTPHSAMARSSHGREPDVVVSHINFVKNARMRKSVNIDIEQPRFHTATPRFILLYHSSLRNLNLNFVIFRE
jgi:hypothetical protein